MPLNSRLLMQDVRLPDYDYSPLSRLPDRLAWNVQVFRSITSDAARFVSGRPQPRLACYYPLYYFMRDSILETVVENQGKIRDCFYSVTFSLGDTACAIRS